MNCKKCGLCCKWILVGTLAKGGELDWDYIKARKIIAVDRGAFISLYVDYPCQHLKDNLCSIQETKPESCIDFPSDRGEALPGCGWFEDGKSSDSI